MKRSLETANRRLGVGIPYNPILEIECPKGSNQRNRLLRDGELERLLTAASSQCNIFITPIIEFAIQTGVRVLPISANCFRLAWERCRNKAGISDLRFHDLRHEAVSRFFEMGMSVPEVALISGHKDVRQLFRYTHLNPTNVFKKYKAF